MVIVENSYKDSILNGDMSACTVSFEDQNESSTSLEFAGGSVSCDGASDVDSGMASDEFDLLELGEPGTELCQVGNQSFIFPQELYDLPNLGLVISLKTWNQSLTEEERFALAEYLPDMDQENFVLTLNELFSGSNFHFGRPLEAFFNQLKGGLCNPTVVAYRRGLNIFQRHQHYHQLCEYQNSMVGNLVHIRDMWQNCSGYGIEERLRFLNILRNERNLGYDRNGDLGSETDCGSIDSNEAYWSRRLSKGHQEMHSSRKASFDAFTQRSRLAVQPVRSGKAKVKGILKLAAAKVPAKKEYARAPGFDLSEVRRSVPDDNYFEDPGYGMAGRSVRGTTAAKSGSLKFKRKGIVKRYAQDMPSDFGVEDVDEHVGNSSYLNNRKESVQALPNPIASYDYKTFSRMTKVKQPNEDWKYPAKEQLRHQVANGSQFDSSDSNRLNKHGKVYEKAICTIGPRTFNGSKIRKKWEGEDDFRINKSSFGSKVSSCKAPPAEWSGSHFHSDYVTKNLQGQLRRKSSEHDEAGVEYSRRSPIYDQSEETQSDSSDKVEAGGGMYPYASKSVHSNAAMEVRQSVVKLEDDFKLTSKLAKSSKRVYQTADGDMNGKPREMEPYSRNVKKKGKSNDTNYLDSGKSIRKSRLTHFSEKLQPASLGCAADRKRKVTTDHSNDMCNHIRGITDEAEEILDLNAGLTNMERQKNRAENKNQISTDFALDDDTQESLSMPILACNSRSKKRKGKSGDEYHAQLDEPFHRQSSPKKQIEGSSTMKKKGKRKADAVVVTSSVATPEPIILEKRGSELEMDVKTQKKPFTLITPTIHTGFSFSIIHLLSAVRKALTTAQMEDPEDIGNHLGKDVSMLANGGGQKFFLHMANDTYMSRSIDNLDGIIQSNLPSLRVQEIVHRVKSNPGDPCILETSEPLQDLVRGVLKIFSSKTAPLGAKGWKALVLYEKSAKSWSWVGPVSSTNSDDNDNTEDETSAEAWGIPHKMLVKLVDAFANWLKNGQETLQQIGSLPAPPAMLAVVDYKDRFRDLRAQKSLNTISSSSEEARAYFHREELLRYSIPDRAFQYTAHDGRKTIVAPLRRCGGKPTSKARDHYMLKPDRPPHVTVLCLVRDAAARLPGGIGTRADVCTLIRDSQYIVEDVTDAQVNQVISGALDRLHYERDPCVQFDGERKLWVYLHGDREEEDFEDDGTSSTKKWKRQRKDPTDPSEVETANDSHYLSTGEPAAGFSSACEFNSDLNMDDNGELVFNDLSSNRENVQSYVSPTRFERGSSNPLQESKMLCQENLTNQDFDDEAFSRERPVGLLSAGLF
ncbi:uncharacterized protein LOC110113519 isoform X1 [Dendrobium catenatum]|uniref:uncharacterized protein LOC110113519 isoform X1 n=1 Tax=Dendrobium catenatum TaxID=906689 RepID=UPI0009F56678|nr:uncharacterized protein LOC110113519 isoform X1 [Dendrobium catenatum]